MKKVGDWTWEETDSSSGPAAFDEAMKVMARCDFAVLMVDPRHCTTDEVASIVHNARRHLGDGKQAIVFGLGGERDPIISAIESVVTRDWCADFVEKFQDLVPCFVDEPMERLRGRDLTDFPGIGRLRMLALGGYGELESGPGREYSMALNQQGIALLSALRGPQYVENKA